MMGIRKSHKLVLVLAPLVLLFSISAPALAVTVNYNNLISDPVFDNSASMSASQIDSFLNSFSSSCISTNHGFSAVDPAGYNPTNGFLYGSAVSAGKVIYDAAQAYEINPQVLLTTLQKEQSLVVGDAGCSVLRYTGAMGYGCPDGGTTYNYSNLSPSLYYINGSPVRSVSGTCVNTSSKAGFTQQVIRAAWLLKFSRERSEGKVSWAIIKGNWDNSDDLDTTYSGYMTQGTWQRCSSCAATYYDGYATIDGSAVHMDSGATASLYVYTPHKSGNSNFVTIFSTWFGSTTGSILFKLSSSSTYYLEWGGYYYPIPSGEILQAYGLSRITPRIISSLPSDETQGPVLQRCVKFGSDNTSDPDYTATIDLVEGGQRHDAPNWSTLNAHGFSSYVNYPASLEWVVSQGDALRPVVKAPNGAIYLMENGKKRLFPDHTTYSTLSGPNYLGTNQVYSQQSLTRVSTEYIDTVDEGAPMLLDGTYIKPGDSAAIYLYDGGKKYYFTPTSYYAWGRKLDYQFTSTAIGQITDGGSAPIEVSSSSGSKYLVDRGKKKQMSPSLESAWGFNDGQFILMTDRALARLSSATASNLITDSTHTVYQIGAGSRHAIPTLADFYGLGYSWSSVDTVANSTAAMVPSGPNLLAPGVLVRTPDGTVYIINSNYSTLGIGSGALFSRFGYSWSKVRNVSNSMIAGYSNSSLQTLLKNTSDGSYYEIDKGVKHLVDSSTFAASQYSMSTWPSSDVDAKVLSGIKSSTQLTRYIRGSSTTVYYIENGQKRGITSQATFYSLGGSWDKVVSVSEDFLAQIPTGANL